MRPSSAGARLAILSPPGAPTMTDPGPSGGFEAVLSLGCPLSEGAGTVGERLRAAADLAAGAGCDWMLRLGPGESLAPGALALASPALQAYDAIFGAARIAGSTDAVWRPSRLAFDEPERLPHALLHWWVGDAPFLRIEAARAVLDGLDGGATRLDHLFAFWRGSRCIKLAQPLLVLAREPLPCGDEDRAAVLARLAREPVFLPVASGGRTYELPYTGRNAGIEREQTRGLFFEAAELGAIGRRIGPGKRIADIGANTGNHTVFFAGPMAAARVIPFEPLPEVADVLRSAVGRNALGNVDLGHLGVGLSDRRGRARAVRSERGGFGASRLQDDPCGEIEVLRLDDRLTQAVDFLKIDVESMEMRVLAGAQKMIERCRPVIFIEIANANTLVFLDWLQANGYGIERIFSDKGHANYLIAPAGG